MPLQFRLAFVAASALLPVIPGPAMLTVVSYSRAPLPRDAAFASGDATSPARSRAGIGTLLAAAATGFMPLT